jgi:hypothetical protein
MNAPMTTFKNGGMAVCVEPGPFGLVRNATYRIESFYTNLDGGWLDLGSDLGAFDICRFRPETVTEAMARMAITNDPLRGSPAAPRPTGLPDDNPKTRFGVAKPSVTLIPGPALIHCALAFRDGATKYGPANWRVDPVTASTYTDAAFRHLLDYWDGEDRASDSGVLHLAHAMACLAILIDAQEQGTLKDDRPTKGTTPRVIEENTRPIL